MVANAIKRLHDGSSTSVRSNVTEIANLAASGVVEESHSQPQQQHDLALTVDAQNSPPDSGRYGVPFWNRNIPLAEYTEKCPAYLEYAWKDHKDRRILNMPDSEYRRQTWEEVQDLTSNNRLDLFKRVPSELRLYRKYCDTLVKQYGSIMRFVLDERLHWKDLSTTGQPFDDPEAYKILYNDWPYGVDERIVHLVVWTKFALPADPQSEVGDMAPKTRKMIANFVDETFVRKCGYDNVIWFRNWQTLKSVHAVEHFHVMLFDPDMDFVSKITGGDEPLFMKVKIVHKDCEA